jgi:hypothetical protein
MSNTDTTGFGKFVPGFDFLQSLAQGAAGSNSTMPNFSKWVAPTLDMEELDKRIEELKIVRFWLEQNSNALVATIQALEVQKMTLATLKGMNFGFGDTATADKPQDSESKSPPSSAPKQTKDAEPAAGVIDPMQMWGALTQQFQKIAQSAVNDASNLAAQTAKAAATATRAMDQTAASTAPKRAPAKKAGTQTARPSKRK